MHVCLQNRSCRWPQEMNEPQIIGDLISPSMLFVNAMQASVKSIFCQKKLNLVQAPKMRNSSDIFNLKDQKDGDSTGNGVFSVNGQCPLRNIIHRGRNLHMNSSSFEYGSADSHRIYDAPQYGTGAQQNLGRGDTEKRAYQAIEQTNSAELDEDLKYIPEETDSQTSSTKNTPRGDADDFNDPQTSMIQPDTNNRRNTPTKNPDRGQSSKKSPQFQKLNDRLAKLKMEDSVSESVMSRNPLTGAGMEQEQQRRSKKGWKKEPKWSW